jgi:hypothetical protein
MSVDPISNKVQRWTRPRIVAKSVSPAKLRKIVKFRMSRREILNH